MVHGLGELSLGCSFRVVYHGFKKMNKNSNVSKNNVAAIVVSFNDPTSLVTCVRSLAPQVGEVIVVDNCSDEDVKNKFLDLSKIKNCSVIYLSTNTGIGYAINKGVKSVRSPEIEWVLLMDQDSVPSSDMVNKLLLSSYANKNAMYVPTISDIGHKKNRLPISVSYAITSGSFLAINNYWKVGGLNDKLFIDGVDFDFSFKLRKENFKIIRVPDAYMCHKLGGEKKLRCYLTFHTVHKPFRRYYMVRNLVHNVREHGKKFPFFCFKLILAAILSVVSVMVFGPSRIKSLIMMIKGLKDGFIKKFGMLT